MDHDIVNQVWEIILDIHGHTNNRAYNNLHDMNADFVLLWDNTKINNFISLKY